MAKLLLIAYPFPPVPYSGTYRIIRICKGLSCLGVEVHALSIKIDDNIPNDYDLLKKLPSEININRTYIPDPWLKYQKWKKNNKGRKGFRYINKILYLLLKLITIPDHQIFWIPFAVIHSRKILKKNNIKTILISTPPNSSQLIGYFLKKITKVKWIADFRDPIVGNIAATHLINPTDFISKIETMILIALEKLVVKNADIAIANTETHRKALTEKFKTDNFITIRNSFDEDDYKGFSKEKYNKFTIAHVGSIYGLRKADILFEAVKKLEESIMPEVLNLQILFVGNCGDDLKRSINNYGVEKYVEMKGLVPHKEAIQIMMRSHLLLLIKATGEGSLGQIPAKFFEYVGTKNKVLCLGPKESEVAKIIRELNVGYVIEKDTISLLNILNNEYQLFIRNLQSTVDCDISKLGMEFMARAVRTIVL
jgi:hypothetical protein